VKTLKNCFSSFQKQVCKIDCFVYDVINSVFVCANETCKRIFLAAARLLNLLQNLNIKSPMPNFVANVLISE